MIPPRDDIDSIMGVMTVAFPPAFGEAWTRGQLESALIGGNCHYLLADREGQVLSPQREVQATFKPSDIAGFALLRVTFDEEELLLFAVRPEFRGQGIGGRLLAAAIADARARNMQRLLLEMRRDNEAARIYTAFGFEPVGIRKGYYRRPDNSTCDAITFALRLD